MIERKYRDEYAQLLRSFVSGNITNFEYEDKYEKIKFESDEGINQIFCEMWLTYCDLREHKITDDGWGFESKEARKTIVRFILFLHSEFSYEWPIWTLREGLIKILTLGFKGLSKEKLDKVREGDQEVWPFYKKEDYEFALSNPKLLSR